MSKPRIIARTRIRAHKAIHEILLTDKFQFVLKSHDKKQREAEKIADTISNSPECKCYKIADYIKRIRGKVYLYERNKPKFFPKSFREIYINYEPGLYSYKRGIDKPRINKKVYLTERPRWVTYYERFHALESKLSKTNVDDWYYHNLIYRLNWRHLTYPSVWWEYQWEISPPYFDMIFLVFRIFKCPPTRMLKHRNYIRLGMECEGKVMKRVIIHFRFGPSYNRKTECYSCKPYQDPEPIPNREAFKILNGPNVIVYEAHVPKR